MKNLFKLMAVSTALLLTLPAHAEVAVVVGQKSTLTSMTPDQVSQIFLGKNSSVVPVDQTDSTGLRTEFYKKVTGKDTSQVKAVWSKLIFTGKATLPKELSSSAEVKKAISSDPNAIGYIEKSAIDSTVKSVLIVQ